MDGSGTSSQLGAPYDGNYFFIVDLFPSVRPTFSCALQIQGHLDSASSVVSYINQGEWANNQNGMGYTYPFPVIGHPGIHVQYAEGLIGQPGYFIEQDPSHYILATYTGCDTTTAQIVASIHFFY